MKSNVEIASTHRFRGDNPDACDECFNARLSFAADPRPERVTKVVGSLPRRDGPSPALLVRFDAKPTKSEGGLHLPLSQQVEPEWATCVQSGRTKEPVPVGARLLVKAHFNGDPLPGTDCHWLAEDDVLGVEEA